MDPKVGKQTLAKQCARSTGSWRSIADEHMLVGDASQQTMSSNTAGRNPLLRKDSPLKHTPNYSQSKLVVANPHNYSPIH